MSQIKTLNGVQYTLPQYNDTGWGANTGNVLTQYIAAIADVTLQLSGGSFTLTADVNFGATYGLVSAYFTSRTTTPATAGAVRLAKSDVISWRNNANGANINISKDTSDNLQWNATKILLSGAVVNADINASAAIAYSKLALTASIVNADISASAAIAYSKLALTGAILNADLAGSIAYSKLVLTGSIVNADMVAGTLTNTAINATAAIARSKMAALTASRAMVTDASGFDAVSAVTATELGYVSGVTSAIQTQINAISSKYFQTVQATSSTQTLTTNAAYQGTNLTATITPSSSSHRIKITVSGVLGTSNSTCRATITVKRGATDLDPGGAGKGFAFFETTTGGTFAMGSFSYIDSPATTSATTYLVTLKSSNANNAIFGDDSSAQVIILEEIA